MTDETKSTALARVPRAALAPTPLAGETVELETAFADSSLEMDETGEKFRLAAALQTQIAEHEEDLNSAATDIAALEASMGTAQADIVAAQSDADAAQATATSAAAAAAAAQTTANTALAAAGASPPMIYLLRAPSSPPVANWNDEFDTGSPDLAVRGWTIHQQGSATILTRAGDVDPNSLPAAGTYRSSLIGTKLAIQVPIACFISKSVAGSCALAARVNCLNMDASGAQPWNLGICTTPQMSGSTSAARFICGWFQQNQAKLLEYVGPSTYTNRGTVNTTNVIQGYDTMWMTATFTGGNLVSAQARHMIVHGSAVVASVFSGSIAGYGVPLYGGVGLPAGNVYGLFEIDYIRQYAVDQFFTP